MIFSFETCIETIWKNKDELTKHCPYTQNWLHEYIQCFSSLSYLHQFDWKRYIREYQSKHQFNMAHECAVYYVWKETETTGYIQNTNNIYRGFDYKSYLRFNTDLKLTTEFDAYSHWVQYGRNENRVVDERMYLRSKNAYLSFIKKLLSTYLYYEEEPVHEFDWKRYIQENSDLKNVHINNEHKAYTHWIQNGNREGRKVYIVNTDDPYKIFNWKLFVKNNAELSQMCVSNPVWAYEYWCKWSRREKTQHAIKIKKNINIFKNREQNGELYDLLIAELNRNNNCTLLEFINTFVEKYIEKDLRDVDTIEQKDLDNINRNENMIFCYGDAEDQNKTLDVIKDFQKMCYFQKNSILKICCGKIYHYPDFIDSIKALLVGYEKHIYFLYNLSIRDIILNIHTCSSYLYCSKLTNDSSMFKMYTEEMNGINDIKDYYTTQLPLYNKIIIFVPYCDVYRKYILECLNSIEIQDYTNFEVVIFNDGSSNLDIILDFMENKSNYSIINWDENRGPGYAKYKMVEHVQQSNYGHNDIMIIIDGDDYLSTPKALTIINSRYIKTKCWVTCGNYSGKWSENIKQCTNKYIENEGRRKEKNWYFPPIRTCKIELMHHINKDIFTFEGEYIRKSTDTMLFVNILELCSPRQIQFISDSLYVYREHEHNTYKTVDSTMKQNINSSIQNGSPLNKKTNTVHLIMSTYNRNENLDNILQMVSAQTVARDITFHIIDNNVDKSKNDYITSLVKKYQSVLNIKLYQFGYNYHCYSKVMVAKQIYHKYLLDYLIMIDEYEIYPPIWCENMLKKAQSLSIYSMYSNKYEYNSEITNKSLCNETDIGNYFGSNGCIIDASLFLYNELYKFDNYDYSITKNVDIWMSFVFNKYLNIPFYRVLETSSGFICNLNKKDEARKQVEMDLMKLFVQDYQWKLDAKQETLITVNNYFDKIYVLNLKRSKLKRCKMRDQLNDLNISATFVEGHDGIKCDECIKYIEDYMKWDINHPNVHPNQTLCWNSINNVFTCKLLRTAGTIGIIRSMKNIFHDAIKQKYNRILIMQDDIMFDKQFAIKFDKYIRNIPDDWEILNLGTTNWRQTFKMEEGGYYCANATTYGSFAQGFSQDVLKQIIVRLEKPNISFDSLLSCEFSQKYYCLYPSLCIADLSQSDSGKNIRDLIESMGKYNPNDLHWNLESKNYLPYWNIDVNVYYTGEKPRHLFHYYNYKMEHLDKFDREIHKHDYLLILNNANSECYYDVNLIGNMVTKMKTKGVNLEKSINIEITNFDCSNHDMMCKYIQPEKKSLHCNNQIPRAILYKSSVYYNENYSQPCPSEKKLYII